MPQWPRHHCNNRGPGLNPRNVRDGIRAEGHFDPVQQYHVAAVYNGSTINLFVNGVRQTNGRRSDSKDKAVTPAQQQKISLQDLHKQLGLFIGSTHPLSKHPHGMDHFSGIIDELRISKVARYDKDFTPATRFERDEHTLALYHFDEAQGDQLKDASGNNHHGKIAGANWVQVDSELKEIETPAADEPTTNDPDVESPVSAPVS